MKRTRRDLKRGAWKRLGFMLLAGLLSASAKAWGWGAVNGFCPTHQLILRQAYALLRTDGAFRGIPFPSIDDILSYEGVTAWRSHLLTVRATGPGPDADGATNYSDHYFNPAIGRGFAPAVVFHYFSLFFKRTGSGLGEERGLGLPFPFRHDRPPPCCRNPEGRRRACDARPAAFDRGGYRAPCPVS